MKQNGVTMIEALLASTIIGISLLGYMQYKKMEMKDSLISEFEYDFKKVMSGFEEKIHTDGLLNKKYWTNFSFDENINNNLIRNLTDKSNDCDGLSTLNLNNKNYISCISPIRMRVFNVDINGAIKFYNNDDFKSYSFNFIPKDNKKLKNIKLLSISIKKVLKDSELYSNVDFFLKNKRTTYSKCISDSKNCYLRMTFGNSFDYLDKENAIASDVSSSDSSDVESYDVYNSGENDYFNKDNKDNKDNQENKHDQRDTRTEKQILKDELKENGVVLSNKDFNKLKLKIEEIKNNPEIIERFEKEFKRNCAQYDEDDYYFMSIYDKNNSCFRAYGK